MGRLSRSKIHEKMLEGGYGFDPRPLCLQAADLVAGNAFGGHFQKAIDIVQEKCSANPIYAAVMDEAKALGKLVLAEKNRDDAFFEDAANEIVKVVKAHNSIMSFAILRRLSTSYDRSLNDKTKTGPLSTQEYENWAAKCTENATLGRGPRVLSIA